MTALNGDVPVDSSRGGGTLLANTCRTERQCTRYLSATASDCSK